VSNVASDWSSDDDQLLSALGEALRVAQEVPRGFVEAGKAAIEWPQIDSELAALTYDSALDTGRTLATVRAEPAQLRYLTFTSPEVTIELEVSGDALLGQVVPPQSGELEILAAGTPARTADIDAVGCFVIRPIPSGPFRLHCHLADANVVTDWIVL
jgi:hypothetical protein